jgi:predicted MFS family arabinose efflux permease
MTFVRALAIGSLGLAGFAFVTTEMLPVGLLPQIAESLQTGIAATGLLVTLYAFTVASTAVPLTAWSARIPRRSVLFALLAILIATNALAAVAPSYGWLFAARFVNALAHGVFWSIVGTIAVRLVAAEEQGTALAAVFAGVSLASVLGVPTATFIGQQFGWRSAFGTIAATGVLVLLVVVRLIDDRSASDPPTPTHVRELLAHGTFRSLLITTVLVVLGQFVGYTFIVPYMQRVDGFAPSATAPLLLFFGVAGAVGNLIAGAVANRSASAASLGANAAIALALGLLICSTASHPLALAAIGLWGMGSGGLAVGLQTRVYALATERPELGSSLFAGAFNIGIGGGALLGSGIVRIVGLSAIVPIGAGLAILGLFVQARSVQMEQSRRFPTATEGSANR